MSAFAFREGTPFHTYQPFLILPRVLRRTVWPLKFLPLSVP